MRLLLDTHALLWWFVDDERLSAGARALIADEANEVLVSAASAWEIATKHRLGKLPHAADAYLRFEELVVADGFVQLPISYRHCLRAGGYPLRYGDAFDRMLAAQAELEGVALLTLDPAFADFPIETLW
ncbi:PIN domain protein [mine drainage metagenome]|uniref:PIN domain protein n=1 Tax=mine drainage metagenome TaxID=410659 RepID=A0A1J5T3I1_9ZZZZ